MSIKGKKKIELVSIQLVKEKNLYFENNAFTSPQEAASIFSEFIGSPDREVFAVACLNSKKKVTNIHIAHIGGISSSEVDVSSIFKTAILSNADSIICAHNHPSGDPIPSTPDIEVTKVIAKAGNILDIHLLDHIILGDDGLFISLKDKNYF